MTNNNNTTKQRFDSQLQERRFRSACLRLQRNPHGITCRFQYSEALKNRFQVVTSWELSSLEVLPWETETPGQLHPFTSLN